MSTQDPARETAERLLREHGCLPQFWPEMSNALTSALLAERAAALEIALRACQGVAERGPRDGWTAAQQCCREIRKSIDALATSGEEQKRTEPETSTKVSLSSGRVTDADPAPSASPASASDARAEGT